MKDMKRLKKENGKEEPYLTISDFPLQRWCMLFAELYSGKLLMDRTVMGYWHQDFLR